MYQCGKVISICGALGARCIKERGAISNMRAGHSSHRYITGTESAVSKDASDLSAITLDTASNATDRFWIVVRIVGDPR